MAEPESTPTEKKDRPASLKRAPRPAADEGADPVDTTMEPLATRPRTGKKRGPYNVQRIDKRPASFRLPPDVLELINKAREEATANGTRLTKDDAVTMAIRAFWGKKRQRR